MSVTKTKRTKRSPAYYLGAMNCDLQFLQEAVEAGDRHSDLLVRVKDLRKLLAKVLKVKP